MNNKTLWLVVPVYNEENIIKLSAKKIKEYLDTLITKGKISSTLVRYTVKFKYILEPPYFWAELLTLYLTFSISTPLCKPKRVS